MRFTPGKLAVSAQNTNVLSIIVRRCKKERGHLRRCLRPACAEVQETRGRRRPRSCHSACGLLSGFGIPLSGFCCLLSQQFLETRLKIGDIVLLYGQCGHDLFPSCQSGFVAAKVFVHFSYRLLAKLIRLLDHSGMDSSCCDSREGFFLFVEADNLHLTRLGRGRDAVDDGRAVVAPQPAHEAENRASPTG